MPDETLTGLTAMIVLHHPTMEEALRAHAHLLRAAWHVIATWEADPCSIDQMNQVIRVLRETVERSVVRCACDPPLSGEAWCTSHCAMAWRAQQGAHDVY